MKVFSSVIIINFIKSFIVTLFLVTLGVAMATSMCLAGFRTAEHFARAE